MYTYTAGFILVLIALNSSNISKMANVFFINNNGCN